METVRDHTIQRVSLVDNVTERLRGALLSGEIKPGERIRVAELEKTFRRLEAEGMIIALPQRAAVAAGVDLEDLGGLYDLRRVIECEVIRRSVASMTPEQVARVEEALRVLVATAQDNDSPEFWERHMDFHWSLLEPAASAWVKRVLDQMWIASQRYVRIFVSETIGDAMRDHRDLLAACKKRDADRAEKILRRHLDRTELAVRKAFVPSDASAS